MSLMRLFRLLLLAVVLLAAVAGCEQEEPEVAPGGQTPAADGAYPAPTLNVPAPEAYPAPSTPTGVLFALDRPIEAGDTSVSGVGPSGLPVTIVNVTFMGEALGAGIISENGTFHIDVSPIPPGIAVGLTGDLEAAGLTESDARPGERPINVPLVGYFFDSVVIPSQ